MQQGQEEDDRPECIQQTELDEKRSKDIKENMIMTFYLIILLMGVRG